MKKLIYTSFSPNIRNKDLLLIVSLLINPFFKINGKYSAQISDFFREKYRRSVGAFTFNFARSGMFVLFKSLLLPSNSEVMVLGFTCSAAVNPIKWSGLKPVYIDVNSSTGNMLYIDILKKLNENTKVILFQHTFGNSSGITEVRNLCKQKDLILIEDCTNCILSYSNGELIGSFGDASIFSFGRDKAITGVDGGLILINNSKLLKNFVKEYEFVKPANLGWVYRELLYPIIWQFIKIFYNLKIGSLIHFLATKSHLLAKATSNEEKLGKMPKNIPNKLPNALAHLSYYQLSDILKLNNHRNYIYDIYKKELSVIDQIRLFEFENGNVPLRFPLIVKDKIGLSKYLKKNNILVGDWYDKPIVPLTVSLEDYGFVEVLCPNSVEMCRNIINLPLHINISQKDACYVASLIRNYYKNGN